MTGVQITVYGKVQGVWFRKYTQNKALELELYGCVKNQADGTVFIEAYGKPNNIQVLINWLQHEGSPLSEVIKIDVSAANFTHQYTSFSIQY